MSEILLGPLCLEFTWSWSRSWTGAVSSAPLHWFWSSRSRSSCAWPNDLNYKHLQELKGDDLNQDLLRSWLRDSVKPELKTDVRLSFFELLLTER